MRQIYLSLLLLTILISQSAAAKHVLFDQAHNQRFVIDDDKLLDLSNFAKIFTDQNYTVDANHQSLTAKILAKTDVLIISGAFSAYQPKELESIMSFVTTGGLYHAACWSYLMANYGTHQTWVTLVDGESVKVR
jgi:hypothetical protein